MLAQFRKYSLENPNICFQVGKILASSLQTIFYAKQLGNRQLLNSYLLALAYGGLFNSVRLSKKKPRSSSIF